MPFEILASLKIGNFELSREGMFPGFAHSTVGGALFAWDDGEANDDDERPEEPELRDDFEEFRNKEEAVWKNSGQTKKKRGELIRPSGKLSARLAGHLRYLTFRSHCKLGGEFADLGNPCTL